ncbi:DUF4197 domain-containing protein [Guyparkeria sp.]|uniref:DUF4197 domain-containing protein n=1 Tax=Guyparkeria sp. TaxID=2035736 RepID=UPI0035677B3C
MTEVNSRRSGTLADRLMRTIVLCLIAGLAAGCADMPQLPYPGSDAPGQAAMVRGIKESLEIGSIRAADLLSKDRGYLDHPVYRIRLPEAVQPIAGSLRRFGLGPQLDRVELLMNRAAEQAAGEAKAVFVDAVRAMTISDAVGIVRGHDTAATDYFRRQTEASLRERYSPIIQSHLQQLGFYSQYRLLLAAYNRVPVAGKPDLDLEQHALTQSLDALFRQVAEEEKLIRQDPLGRGSRAIAAVFGR